VKATTEVARVHEEDNKEVLSDLLQRTVKVTAEVARVHEEDHTEIHSDLLPRTVKVTTEVARVQQESHMEVQNDLVIDCELLVIIVIFVLVMKLSSLAWFFCCLS
jgi:hypothetical protein